MLFHTAPWRGPDGRHWFDALFLLEMLSFHTDDQPSFLDFQ
jgi:hypothetical protein